jgi:RNA polymerase sigma factor (sigma-70 family)
MANEVPPDAIPVLVEHHRQFLKFLEPRLGSRSAAEDLLQTAFVKGIERSREIRDGESAVAWFYRLLRNALVDYYRHRDAGRRALERHGLEMDSTVQHDAAVETLVCHCVHDLIPTLKDEYAEVLRAVEIEGLSVADAAHRLGITAGNAAVRVHRARQALKARLVASCGTCTEHGCLDCTCQRSPGATGATGTSASL